MEHRIFLFAGGYTEPIQMGSGEIVQGRCGGVSCYAFDPNTAKLERLDCAAETINPSYVLADPRARRLYCVNEQKEHGGTGGSTVSAYEILPGMRGLRPIGRQPSGGADACHLNLSPDGRFLLAANYGGGSFCVFPIAAEGLGAPSCLLRHSGTGRDPERQAAPHAHQTILAPDGRHVYVTDLGLDRLLCYRADWERGWLLPEPGRDIQGIPGQGLRHGAFGAGGDRLYVMTELSCEVNVYAVDPRTGAWELLQRAACQEREPAGDLGAAIRLHPSGRWLYATVRGANLVCAFAIGADGWLTPVQREPSRGRIPREMALSPDGRFLLVGNQESDSVAIFAVDPANGGLRYLRTQEDVPCVTTLAFWEEM